MCLCSEIAAKGKTDLLFDLASAAQNLGWSRKKRRPKMARRIHQKKTDRRLTCATCKNICVLVTLYFINYKVFVPCGWNKFPFLTAKSENKYGPCIMHRKSITVAPAIRYKIYNQIPKLFCSKGINLNMLSESDTRVSHRFNGTFQNGAHSISVFLIYSYSPVARLSRWIPNFCIIRIEFTKFSYRF